jgi:hypothetical protein
MNKAVIASMLMGTMWGISLPSVPPAVAQTLPTVQPSAATANPVKIELLGAGAEPRRELKFRPTANSKQTMTMTMGMSMEMTVGETPIPKTPIPKMMLKIDALVQRVDPSGDIYCSFGYNDIRAIADKDASPEALAAMQKSLKSMVGTKIDLVVGSDGQMKRKNLSLPKNIDPTIKQSLAQFDRSIEQISTPLPAEKIGLGAKWRVNNSIQVSGIKFDRSSTYEVVEINDTGMTVKATISQSAPPQDLPIPGAEKDAKGKIVSLVSSGEGKYAIRFDSLLPISGNSSSKTDSKTTIQVSPKEPLTNMASKISIDLNMSSK